MASLPLLSPDEAAATGRIDARELSPIGLIGKGEPTVDSQSTMIFIIVPSCLPQEDLHHSLQIIIIILILLKRLLSHVADSTQDTAFSSLGNITLVNFALRSICDP